MTSIDTQGFIGLEMAESIHMGGLKITMIQRSAQVIPTLDPDMDECLGQALLEKGIDLHVNEMVQGFVQKDGLAVAVITNNQTIPADLIILGLGVIPNSELEKKCRHSAWPERKHQGQRATADRNSQYVLGLTISFFFGFLFQKGGRIHNLPVHPQGFSLFLPQPLQSAVPVFLPRVSLKNFV